MKLNLKISPQQLNALVHHFPKPPYELTKSREIKVARSVLDKVIVKFEKKQVENQRQVATLFTKPKKISFSLEYFEAHYLEQFVIAVEGFPMNEYDRNVLRLIKTILNKQLV